MLSCDGSHHYFEAYRTDRIALSGARRGKRNQPLLPPGGEDRFELAVGSQSANRGGAAPAADAIDRLSLTSVLWDDNLVEGGPERAAQERTQESSGVATELGHRDAAGQGCAAGRRRCSDGELRRHIRGSRTVARGDDP